jgi:hypothetical protein
MSLRRYWITFDFKSADYSPPGTLVGCGVTAHSYEDAMELIKEKVFKGNKMPMVNSAVENVDVSSLDPGHVLPNIGNVFRRGIWYPLGYEISRF